MSGLDETILGQLGIAGTYTLTSAPANAVALAPAGATYTAFTGELLQLLRTGVPGGPELLTLNEIYRRLRTPEAFRTTLCCRSQQRIGSLTKSSSPTAVSTRQPQRWWSHSVCHPQSRGRCSSSTCN